MNDPVHPDRLAPTLARRELLLDADTLATVPTEGPRTEGDARVELHLLAHRARVALAERGTPAAFERLRGLVTQDLLAGRIPDASARGTMVALEEAISLCEDESPEPPIDDSDANDFEPKILKRKRDILVASGGARIRFSRKGGILFVDRAHDVHEENCIWFEDRSDRGDLDGFVPAPDERPRLFNPGFLKPVRLLQGKRRDLLVLEGRLGRRFTGFDCVIQFEGRKDEDFLRMSLRVDNQHENHRLRIRFLGRLHEILHSQGTPGFETVHHRGMTFQAATIVRACSGLRVGEAVLPTPAAQCRGWIEHHFRLGAS